MYRLSIGNPQHLGIRRIHQGEHLDRARFASPLYAARSPRQTRNPDRPLGPRYPLPPKPNEAGPIASIGQSASGITTPPFSRSNTLASEFSDIVQSAHLTGAHASASDSDTPHYRSPKRMKVLAVTYDDRVPDNSRLYAALGRLVNVTHQKITANQARNLKRTLAQTDLMEFDRVVLDLSLAHAASQWRFLRRIPNLVLFEEDTWQNFAGFTKNEGKYKTFYARAQPYRVIHSGADVAAKTQALGFDSVFLRRSYDGDRLLDVEAHRDVELAFVGRVNNPEYTHRKTFLEQLARLEPLQMLRTNSAAEYAQVLNRIRFFISADIGFGEHMLKNFEAMGCGCVVFAKRQGADDAALGFIDMENIVLYDDVDELRSKLSALRGDENLVFRIANSGRAHAAAHHDYSRVATRLRSAVGTATPGAHRAQAQTAARGETDVGSNLPVDPARRSGSRLRGVRVLRIGQRTVRPLQGAAAPSRSGARTRPIEWLRGGERRMAPRVG